MSQKNYLEGWKPTQDIAIVFDDKTADHRPVEQIDAMFEELRAVVNKHGFDLYQWGTRKQMEKSMAAVRLRELIDRLIAEAR